MQPSDPYLAKYTRDDGQLIWCGKLHRGDSADDFFEAFVNWPLLYLLGGGDHLLPLCLREWEALLAQLTDLGALHDEYERGSDQFHQGEGNLFFYFLCMADPANPRLRDLAQRYASFFLAEAPAGNYDADHQIIRAPRSGSEGPAWGYFAGEPNFPWRFDMAIYGLPYHDLPGITTYDDLRDPAKARRMGEAMQSRMGQGDVIDNLLITSLMTNAFLLTGDERYRAWVTTYVAAWDARRDPTTGLLPDSVGPRGQVGALLDGKWYGGLYGWTWPHGYYNISISTTVAATNAALLTGDPHALDLARTQFDYLLALSELRPIDLGQMSLPHHWLGPLATLPPDGATLQMPYRYGDGGWFDWQPVGLRIPASLWSLSHDPADWQRIQQIHARSGCDWNAVIPFHTKEDAGHEEPWLRYLAGANPDYPERFLQQSVGQVQARLRQIAQDHEDLTTIPDDLIDVKVHHWQLLNPITTEALVQLTLGAPQHLYNGGLLMAPLRYFDPQRRRPGLPADVAALVGEQRANDLTVHLVNLSGTHERTVIIQAGMFGEHQFQSARYSVAAERIASPLGYPGVAHTLAASVKRLGEPAPMDWYTCDLAERHIEVQLPPGSEIHLRLRMAWLQHTPSYAFPWEASDAPHLANEDVTLPPPVASTNKEA